MDVFVKSNQGSKCSMKSSGTPEHTLISWNILLTLWNLYVTHLRKVRQYTFVQKNNMMSTNSDAINHSSLMVAFMTGWILTSGRNMAIFHVGWLLLLLWTNPRSPTRSTNLLCSPPPKKHTNMSPHSQGSGSGLQITSLYLATQSLASALWFLPHTIPPKFLKPNHVMNGLTNSHSCCIRIWFNRNVFVSMWYLREVRIFLLLFHWNSHLLFLIFILSLKSKRRGWLSES